MYFVIKPITRELLHTAEVFFGQDFCNSLKNKENYAGSLIGRYLVAAYVQEQNFQTKKSKPTLRFDDNYKIDDYYFSLSHTKNYIGVVVSPEKTAIDISSYMPRHRSLLEKYKVEITDIMNTLYLSEWRAFYYQRTVKEAIIKYLDISFNCLETIKIVGIKNIRSVINGYLYDSVFSVLYDGRTYNVNVGISQENSLVYAEIG